jgi:chromosome segregation ATPase
MSDERLERIENQLERVIQGMGVMQQNMGVMQQNMGVMQQNISVMQQNMGVMQQDIAELKVKAIATDRNLDAMREDIVSLRNQQNSLQGGLFVAIRDGFNSQQIHLDDLNYAIEENARKTRAVSRRVRRLERLNQDDDD